MSDFFTYENEKYIVRLTPDDPRLGHTRADGSVERWPTLDVLGKEAKRPFYSTRNVGPGLFVIMPVGREHVIDVTVTLPAAEIKARMTAKPDKE